MLQFVLCLVHLGIVHLSQSGRTAAVFNFLTNTFPNLGKYIFQLRQIHFSILTNIFCWLESFTCPSLVALQSLTSSRTDRSLVLIIFCITVLDWQIYLSKLQIIFVRIVNCICSNDKLQSLSSSQTDGSSILCHSPGHQQIWPDEEIACCKLENQEHQN